MKLLFIVLILFMTGCVEKIDTETQIKKGEARHLIFVECMNLAAKITRSGDDDVSDIISECDSISMYKSNNLDWVNSRSR